MARNSAAAVRSFIEPKRFALVGLSRDPKKFSRVVFKELKSKGFEIYPVNPNMDELDGMPCYKSIHELPDTVDRVLIMTPRDKTEDVVRDAIEHRMKGIWIQQGAETKEAIMAAQGKGVNLVSKACIMMHAEAHGIHKFHAFLQKLFGGYPK